MLDCLVNNVGNGVVSGNILCERGYAAYVHVQVNEVHEVSESFKDCMCITIVYDITIVCVPS